MKAYKLQSFLDRLGVKGYKYVQVNTNLCLKSDYQLQLHLKENF